MRGCSGHEGVRGHGARSGSSGSDVSSPIRPRGRLGRARRWQLRPDGSAAPCTPPWWSTRDGRKATAAATAARRRARFPRVSGAEGWAGRAGSGRELLGRRRPRRSARAKHGGTAASCARRPRAARTKDGGGRRFRAVRGSDLRRAGTAGMAAGGGSPSIVEFFGGEDGYRCGYCRSDTGNLSHGAGGAGCERRRGRAARSWPRSGGCGRGAGEGGGDRRRLGSSLRPPSRELGTARCPE